MATEKNSIDSSSKENELLERSKSPDGKNSLPVISSTMKLDCLLNKEKDISHVFDAPELKEVNNLSMKNNELFLLPKNFTQNLYNLVDINLSNNNLTEIDINFDDLKNLQQFVVDRNKIQTLPINVGKLSCLKIFSAIENKLIDIPESFGNLVDLEELDLSGNKINDLPESCVKLNKLRIINLSYNNLKSPPKCILEGLEVLEFLDLSHNFISEFITPPRSQSLRKFYFANNIKNEIFPNWLIGEKFSNLEELVLDETSFSIFDISPEGLPILRIKKLSVINCGLSDTAFDRLSQSMIDLNYINLSNSVKSRDGNIFWVMPAKNLKNPDKICEIYIQAVGLPALPKEINILKNLTRLDVSRNNIFSLPEEICELNKLEFLNVSYNNLYALPQDIGNLTSLKVLFLETNRLTSLPDSMKNLTCLELLDLYNNEFSQVPKQLDEIPNLKALDVDGNAFVTKNLQIANMEYLEARNILRSTSNILLLRSNVQKILSDQEMDDDSSYSSLSFQEDCNAESESAINSNFDNNQAAENWDISEDSADEFDPTAQPRTYHLYSPFTVSSVFYYENFCPADLHSARIKDQLAAMQKNVIKQSTNIEEGQFDDA